MPSKYRLSDNAPCLPAQTEKSNGKKEFLTDIYRIKKAHDKKCPQNADAVGENGIDIIGHIMQKQHNTSISCSYQPRP